MRFPSKVTPYKESIIAKFPLILSVIETQGMTPSELYSKVGKKLDGISEFMDILDCLYALNKVDMEDGVLYYVG